MTTTLDLFASAVSVDDIAAQSRRTGLLPTQDESAHLNAEELRFVAREWLTGSRELAARRDAEVRKVFAARGWPFAWLLATDHPKVDALFEAVDVAERYYTDALRQAALLPESMGVAQLKGFGGAEGIQLKRPAYASSGWLVSVYCVTGPCNFSAGEGVEFEPGAKSHVFHLLYREQPDLETLVGDLAAHPLVTAPGHRPPRARQWNSEGWMGPSRSAPWEHRSWRDTSALG